MNVLLTWFAVVVVALATAAPAAAYVGPGAGLSLLGAFWGLLVAIVAALAFVIAWPVRQLLKRARGVPPRTTPAAAEPAPAAEPARAPQPERPSA